MTRMLPHRMLCIAAAVMALNTPAFALLTITELKARAATNDAASCFELAHRYKRPLVPGKPEGDLSVAKDMAEAQRWFQKAYDLFLPAANNGDNKAQDVVGRICLEGFTDTNRIAEGVMWQRKAADGGNIHAQVNMGMALLRPRWGLERNEEEGAKLLTAAAERRHRLAVVVLVDYYSAKEDYKNAAQWLHMLADFGEREAQSKLGRWYAKGVAVPKDNVEAYKWLSLAAVPLFPTNRTARDPWSARIALQDEDHARSRDVHGALLTPEEMERAKQKIAEFKRTKTFHDETKDP